MMKVPHVSIVSPDKLYTGKIFDQVKGRLLFIVKDKVNFE